MTDRIAVAAFAVAMFFTAVIAHLADAYGFDVDGLVWVSCQICGGPHRSCLRRCIWCGVYTTRRRTVIRLPLCTNHGGRH